MAENVANDFHKLWQKLYMQRFIAGKCVRQELQLMSSHLFHLKDVSNEHMEHFFELVARFEGNDEFGFDEDELQRAPQLKVNLQQLFPDRTFQAKLSRRVHKNEHFPTSHLTALVNTYTAFGHDFAPWTSETFYNGIRQAPT